ncbi:hypothetical protein L9F63_021028, partial [Diploptera punctata]
ETNKNSSFQFFLCDERKFLIKEIIQIVQINSGKLRSAPTPYPEENVWIVRTPA